MSKLVDLTGQVFGRLLVLSFAGTRGKTQKHAYWLCECRCHNRKEIAGTSLTTGRTQSCDCLHKERTSTFKLIDLMGQTFGQLNVIKRAPIPKHIKKSGQAYWECLCNACGRTTIINGYSLRSGKSRTCGCSHWKGGFKLDKWGYRYKWVPKHPAAVGGYIQEHRLVIEEGLGRPLKPTETVHHKNGIKTDNRLENLELRVGNHGVGQSVNDLREWAKELLYTYEPTALSARILQEFNMLEQLKATANFEEGLQLLKATNMMHILPAVVYDSTEDPYIS